MVVVVVVVVLTLVLDAIKARDDAAMAEDDAADDDDKEADVMTKRGCCRTYSPSTDQDADCGMRVMPSMEMHSPSVTAAHTTNPQYRRERRAWRGVSMTAISSRDTKKASVTAQSHMHRGATARKEPVPATTTTPTK